MPAQNVDFELLVQQLQSMSDAGAMEFVRPFLHEYERLMAYYRCAMMEIETKFNVLDQELSLQYDRNPISSIKTRLKSPGSIMGKLKRRDLPLTLEAIEENLNDVAGIRVVCSFPEDVYRLADALLQQDDITLIQRKDYIENPRENGYRSLHLIVAVPIFLVHEKRIMRVEIQLRTIAMDCWASLEHQLRYKKEGDFTGTIARELKECAEISAELDRRMDAVKNYLKTHRKKGADAQTGEAR